MPTGSMQAHPGPSIQQGRSLAERDIFRREDGPNLSNNLQTKIIIDLQLVVLASGRSRRRLHKHQRTRDRVTEVSIR